VTARAGGATWWAGKVRQFGGHIRARGSASERSGLTGWLTPAQLAAFDMMHVADRRHGLDVVGALRVDGVVEPDVLVAGLLHDAGKGKIGVLARVAYSLGQAYGPWVWRLASILPGFGGAIERLRDHPERSASIAAAAGCSERTVDLIRHQDRPRDPQFGELLRLADEAN
jgi:hypothetical protein